MRYTIWVSILMFVAAGNARGADTEGCLNCHQYRGLARVDASGTKVREFFVDPDYYTRGLGPHARLSCSDCHPRSEVEVFPHNQVSKVDCMRACHLGSSTQAEVRFSHQPVDRMLLASVHKPETLRRTNALLGHPLGEKQSQCLLCHDEPVFREAGWMWEDASIQRCGTCHDESLRIDPRLELRHVQARTRPERTVGGTVRLCATCHSNEAVRAEFKLPDSTASYLESFHGKAALLGSENTADCLHCHAGLGQNVHAMLKQADPASPTSPLRAAATCRTAGCHGDAGAAISAAAVHLDIASTHGVEYVIPCLFLALILFTFGPSLLVTVLKLFHYILGRHDPDHAKNHRLAEMLLAQPESRRKLVRFDAQQRFQHWILAVSFTLLCVTGFPMKFADRDWAAWVIDRLGGLAAARSIHHASGLLLIFGFAYHLVYIARLVLRAKKRSGKGLIHTLTHMPMFAGPADGKKLFQLMLYLLFLRRTKPTAGKFHPEEKFEYFGVFWGVFVLGTTGVLMWFNTWTTRHLPGRVLTFAALLHTFEAFLALLHIGIVHMANVILSPEVFPVSKAMITGETHAGKLAEGHAEMLHELAGKEAVRG